MKKFKKLFIITSIIGSLLLSGCDLSFEGKVNNNSNDNNNTQQPDNGNGNNNNNQGSGDNNQGTGNNNQGSGDNNQGSGDNNQGGGDNNQSQGGNTSNVPDTTIRILATNDIHGQIYPEAEAGRVGIGKLMTFVKSMKEQDENALLIDSGDTWQGSIYSNYNYGACITDIMNYVQYDARTIGNHDFDWGVDPIKANTARDYNGYKTPVLGANIYDYNFDTKTVGTTQQSDLGVPSVTYTLASGVKVGILGVIGRSQITSINSLYTRGIAFTDHINAIKSEATKLRNEGCTFVICSIHAGQEEATNQDLENYVDLVLCGHTHKQQKTEEGRLLFAQFGQYTEGVGYIELKYSASTGKVTYNDTVTKMFKYSAINNAVRTVDPTIQGIIDTYVTQCDEKASKVVLNNASDAFDNDAYCSNLMANAIYDKAISEGHDIDFVYVNQPRHYLPAGQWTYADVFEAFPFDNVIYIIDVTAEEYFKEVFPYNYICKSSSSSIHLSPNETLKVACLDYLAWHTNADRVYNYFPSVAKYASPDDVPTLSKTYREILVDWLDANHYDEEGYTLNRSDFVLSNRKFDRDDVTYELFDITYHLYDNETYVGQARYHYRFSSEKIVDPERNNFVFEGWYYDSSYSKPIADDDIVERSFDAYAKWRQSNPALYYTDQIRYNFFEIGSTHTRVAAINDGHDLVYVELDHSAIIDNSQYYEFSLPANGFIHVNVPSGYVIKEVFADEWKYAELEFYEASTVDSTKLVNISCNQEDQYHKVYSGRELALTDLYIYNTYGNGNISLYYIQFTLEKLSV